MGEPWPKPARSHRTYQGPRVPGGSKPRWGVYPPSAPAQAETRKSVARGSSSKARLLGCAAAGHTRHHDGGDPSHGIIRRSCHEGDIVSSKPPEATGTVYTGGSRGRSSHGEATARACQPFRVYRAMLRHSWNVRAKYARHRRRRTSQTSSGNLRDTRMSWAPLVGIAPTYSGSLTLNHKQQ